MIKHYRICVKGIVQGVGFRPFVFSLAQGLGLKGEVVNTGQGVTIHLEGEAPKIDLFLSEMKHNPPPLSMVQEVKAEELSLVNYNEFCIQRSATGIDKKTLVSPDVAVCEKCLAELNNQSDRRYLYPFINCTNCGPRFTIIEGMPYDRPNTTMKIFDMCQDCYAEYTDPLDRRFHAQPNACPVCGPALMLLDREGNIIEHANVVEHATQLLKSGQILAIKGVGGYHLACDALNLQSVKTLRSRKFREDKPFAVMFPEPAQIKKICQVSEDEFKLLTGIKGPIVLLRKRNSNYNLADQVAPDNEFLGVMLPYAPLHYVIFKYMDGPLVMTSANISDEPIAYRDSQAQESLKDIADFFLIHNREIKHRCDDSVTRVFRKQEFIIRRSRGYAPAPLFLKRSLKQILAVGGEQKNTFCLTKENYAFVSHHIGDLENMETLESFEEGIDLYKELFEIEPEIIAYDLHPDYLSTKYAGELTEVKKVAIQHHHAHIVGCMVENELDEKVIGVAFDGTGYGTDGKIWGGEFLLADISNFKRIGQLKYQPLPGGARAIKEPWRMAASYLREALGSQQLTEAEMDKLLPVETDKLSMINQMIEKNINSPLTSSMGRLFDAVSSLLGIRNYVNYEGQGAVEMEQKANGFRNKAYVDSYKFETAFDEDKLEIISDPMIIQIIEDLKERRSIEEMAYKFHLTVADMILAGCRFGRELTAINKVCLSGGVFQNLLLLDIALTKLAEEGFNSYIHRLLPTNDGGISLGQAVIANERG